MITFHNAATGSDIRPASMIIALRTSYRLSFGANPADTCALLAWYYRTVAISRTGGRNRLDAIRIARDAGWL